ncbi:hypothetical protein ACN677_15325 [Lactiplantibacillus paraplantarum]|uniref:hypothetical protein n=1 Tax=Lactiplantibacillus paraplantarum TaxID=60520 RepID=UPI003B27F9AC
MSEFNLIFWGTAIGLFLLEEYVMANTRFFWLGGIIPLLGTIGIILVLIKSGNNQISDYFFGVLGIIVLIIFWGDGHQRYIKRMKKQKNEMLSKDLTDQKNKK